MPVTVVLGEQRGDEGKGRFVDMLAENNEIVARFNGGDNAGHTVCLPDSRVFKLHLLPSGIVHPHTTNIIGNGTLVHPQRLMREIDSAEQQDISITPERLLLSSAAHLIMPSHVNADETREKSNARQGSTKRGIAPAAADKYLRVNARAEMIVEDPDSLARLVIEGLRNHRASIGQESSLRMNHQDQREAYQYVKSAQHLGRFITDTVSYVNDRIQKNPDIKILAEGAQSFWLDIDHGMYPAVTSSSASIGGVITGLGIGPRHIDRIIGVSKAIQSHVGGGPFVTEIHDQELLTRLHGDKDQPDSEVGTTTGRERRLGYFDIPMLRTAQKVNSTDEIAITKLDWVPRLGSTIPLCVGYTRGREFFLDAPSSATVMKECNPVMIHLPNWTEDISHIRDFNDLPDEAKRLIYEIEKRTEKPVTMIGVGPQRDQVIVREK